MAVAALNRLFGRAPVHHEPRVPALPGHSGLREGPPVRGVLTNLFNKLGPQQEAGKASRGLGRDVLPPGRLGRHIDASTERVTDRVQVGPALRELNREYPVKGMMGLADSLYPAKIRNMFGADRPSLATLRGGQHGASPDLQHNTNTVLADMSRHPQHGPELAQFADYYGVKHHKQEAGGQGNLVPQVYTFGPGVSVTMAETTKPNGQRALILAFGGTGAENDFKAHTKADIANALGKGSDTYSCAAHFTSLVKQHAQAQGMELVTTGHSLGGGLATYAALMNDTPCVAFSAPGLGKRHQEKVEQVMRARIDAAAARPNAAAETRFRHQIMGEQQAAAAAARPPVDVLPGQRAAAARANARGEVEGYHRPTVSDLSRQRAAVRSPRGGGEPLGNALHRQYVQEPLSRCVNISLEGDLVTKVGKQPGKQIVMDRDGLPSRAPFSEHALIQNALAQRLP